MRDRRRPLLHGLVLALIVFGFACSVFVSRTFPFQLDGGGPITGLSLPGVSASTAQASVLTSQVVPSTVRRDQMQQALQQFAGQPVAVTALSAGPTAEQATVAPVDPYLLYKVVQGDTASAIASRFGVDLDYLLWANTDLQDGELLAVGQTLVIPAGNGIIHHVRYGETLSDIAVRYGVTVDDILAWSGNRFGSPDQVLEDQTVFVPNGSLPVAAAPVAAAPTDAPTEEPVGVAAPPPIDTSAPVGSPVGAGAGLIWPVFGPISSYMDGSHPLGIDIDLYATPFSAIAAATDGTVVFAGGDACCSYGLYVIIDSPSGIETLYAHLSSIAVSPGQQVTQGQTLGISGCTGYCTGNHLHFEVLDNGVRVNPLDYLP